MSFNLVVWKWSDAYDSAAKRRKLGLKVGDVLARAHGLVTAEL